MVKKKKYQRGTKFGVLSSLSPILSFLKTVRTVLLLILCCFQTLFLILRSKFLFFRAIGQFSSIREVLVCFRVSMVTVKCIRSKINGIFLTISTRGKRDKKIYRLFFTVYHLPRKVVNFVCFNIYIPAKNLKNYERKYFT